MERLYVVIVCVDRRPDQVIGPMSEDEAHDYAMSLPAGVSRGVLPLSPVPVKEE